MDGSPEPASTFRPAVPWGPEITSATAVILRCGWPSPAAEYYSPAVSFASLTKCTWKLESQLQANMRVDDSREGMRGTGRETTSWRIPQCPFLVACSSAVLEQIRW